MKPYHDFYPSESAESTDTLVLLHGWGLNSSVFDALIPELLPHYHVMVIDLPGMGRSPIHNGDYTLEYLTQSVQSVVKDLGHFHLLGWSLGGLVALFVANQLPSQVLSCAVVATNLSFVQRDQWPGVKAHSFAHFQGLLSEDARGCLVRFLALQSKGSKEQRRLIEYLKERVFLYGLPAPKALESGLGILSNCDLRDLIGELPMPLWFGFGCHDELVPIELASALPQRAALRPTSQIVTFSQSAHLPFVTQSADFAMEWRNFLKSVSRLTDEVAECGS